jgi:hypothetical protein
MKGRMQTRTAEVSPAVRDVLAAPGRPLDAAVRAFVEPRFGQMGVAAPPSAPSSSAPWTVGRADDPVESAAEATSRRVLDGDPPVGGVRADFSSIRVHTDALAAAAARSVNARAFASGRHLVFGEGEYRPDTRAGQRLLSHELAHVAHPPASQGASPILRQAIPGTVEPLVPPGAPPPLVPPATVPPEPAPPAPASAAEAPRPAGREPGPAAKPAPDQAPASKDAKKKPEGEDAARASAEKTAVPAAEPKPGAAGKEPPEAGAEAEGASDLAKGNVALIDTELAEHQRWGAASALVGAAGSKERAGFIAQAAAGGAESGLKEGFVSGVKMGVGMKIAEKVIEKGLTKGAVALATRLGAQAGKFTPLPGVGAAIGGALAVYDLASRDWKATGEAIGRFGQGADIYEKLANSIEAISNILEVATAVLNVIAGILGVITIVMWIFAVVTAGVMSPVAGLLTAIAAAIGIGTMVLDAINALVLKQLISTFRELHAFTSQADPRDVVVQGDAISKAAGAGAGFVGGLAGAKVAEGGAKAFEAGAKKLTSPKPKTPVPDHPAPPAATGDGPKVKAELAPEAQPAAPAAKEVGIGGEQPGAPAGAAPEVKPPAGEVQAPGAAATKPATPEPGAPTLETGKPGKPTTETKPATPPEAEPAPKKTSKPVDETSFEELKPLTEEMGKGPFGEKLAAEAKRAQQPPPTAPPGTRFGKSAYKLLRNLLRREQAQPQGTQAQHWTKWLAATRDTPPGQRMTPAQISENRSWLQTDPSRPATLLLTDPRGGGTQYFIGDRPAPAPTRQLDLPGLGQPGPDPRYTTEHRLADNFLIEDAKRNILGQKREAQYPRGSLQVPAGVNRNLLNLWAGGEARWRMEGTPGQGDWGWQPRSSAQVPVQQPLFPGERPQIPRTPASVPSDPRQLAFDFDKPRPDPSQLDLFAQPTKPPGFEPTTRTTDAPILPPTAQPQPADQPGPSPQPAPTQQPVPAPQAVPGQQPVPQPLASPEAKGPAASPFALSAAGRAGAAAAGAGEAQKQEEREPGLVKNLVDFSTMDVTAMTPAERATYLTAGPLGGGAAITAMRGFEQARSEPVVEHVNPNYPPPPGTPQQVVDLENQMLEAQMARAQAEDTAAAMGQQVTHHKANEKPLDDMQTHTKDAVAATEAHKKAVAERTEANKKKEASENKAGGALSDYSDRAAKLATITVPMRGLEKFTGLARSLPDAIPESIASTMPDFLLTRAERALKNGKANLLKMNSDSKNFLDQLDQMDQTIAQQKAGQPERVQQVQADAGTLGQTDQKADQSEKSLSDTQQQTEDLDAKNKDRMGQATDLRNQATQAAATLDAQAQTKDQQSQSLAAALQAWAQSHRQARLTALEATKKSLTDRGYIVTEVKEL